MHGKVEGFLTGVEMTQTSVSSSKRTSALETDHKSGNLEHTEQSAERNGEKKINSGVGKVISVVGTGIVYVRILVPFPAP